MKGNLRRRSCALLAASAAWAATYQALGGVNPHGSSRVTITHDADVNNGTGQIFSTGAISIPRSSNLFPANAYQIDSTHSFLGGTTEAQGSLGHVTNATTASVVLASGTGVIQTDPGDDYPGASSLKFDVNMLWDVGTGGFGPIANGFASLVTGVTVGTGGSASLKINLDFLNQNGNPLRSRWTVNRDWLTAGTFTETFTTSRVLGSGTLAAGPRVRILGSIEFQASNAETPTTFAALRNEFGGAPPTAIFRQNGEREWFSQDNWEPLVAGEEGLLPIANGVGHRALFSGTFGPQSPRQLFINGPVTLGTLDVSGNTPYVFGNFGGGFNFAVQQGNAVINIRPQEGNSAIHVLTQLSSSVEMITDGRSTLTMSNSIRGVGGIIKLGTGELILSGVNSYSGGTTVAEGTLVVGSQEGSSTGTGNVTVLDGAKLGGAGAVGGIVTARNGAIIAPGNVIGSMSMRGLALEPGSRIEIEGAGKEFDAVILTGTDTHQFGGGVVDLVETAPFAVGTYPIINYNGRPFGDLKPWLTLGKRVHGDKWATLVDDERATEIMVDFVQVPQWNIDDDGSFGVAGSWLPTAVPAGPTALAGFLGKITRPHTISLNGNRSVGTIIFDNHNKYTIARGSSGTLSIGDAANPGWIEVAAANHEISAPTNFAGDLTVNVAENAGLTLSGGLKMASGRVMSKTGPGTLTLSGAQGYEAGAQLVIEGGRVNMNSNPSGLAVTILGSEMVLGSSVDLASLAVEHQQPGNQTLDLNSGPGTGAFNAVRVFAADLAGAKAGLWNTIVNANGGVGDALDGIIDSGLHASSGIGLAQKSDHVLMRATRRGDLNLDGMVTIADFIGLASHFNEVGTATWQEGDLNYDLSVTIADFIELAANFNSSYSGETWEIAPQEQAALARFAAAHGVPEPGVMALTMAAGAALLRRRRSRR